MRILIMLGWASGFGGVETVVGLLARQLKSSGHEITIVIDKTGVESTCWLEGLTWQLVDMGLEIGGAAWKLRRLVVCTQLLIKHKPDIVLTDIAYWTPYIRYARRFTGQRRKPIIASWIHTQIDPENVTFRRWISSADTHLAISPANFEYIQRFIGLHATVYLVNNPILPPVDTDESRISDKQHIMFVGRLAPEKRVDVLLKSVAHLADMDFRLSIVGDGPSLGMLHMLEQQLQIPSGKIIWHGWKDNPWEDMGRATVLVLPSDSEGFGLVIIEALARGIPFIVSTEQQFADCLVRKHRVGWQFQARNAESLANVLRRVLNQEVPVPTRERMQQVARPYLAPRWAEHLEKCLLAELYSKRELYERTVKSAHRSPDLR